jgi:hypothetical protein
MLVSGPGKVCMEVYFTKDYFWLWMLALTLLLVLPVRQLIWVLYVRRAQKQGDVGDAERERLKRRALATSVLLSLVFSYFYVTYLFRN